MEIYTHTFNVSFGLPELPFHWLFTKLLRDIPSDETVYPCCGPIRRWALVSTSRTLHFILAQSQTGGSSTFKKHAWDYSQNSVFALLCSCSTMLWIQRISAFAFPLVLTRLNALPTTIKPNAATSFKADYVILGCDDAKGRVCVPLIGLRTGAQ